LAEWKAFKKKLRDRSIRPLWNRVVGPVTASSEAMIASAIDDA
jgi:hypothetical protein